MTSISGLARHRITVSRVSGKGRKSPLRGIEGTAL